MLFIQNKKLSLFIVIAFLIIVLLCSNIHVQAENTDKRDMAEALWEQGIKASDENDYQTALEKFNNSLTICREIGDRQSEADLLTWIAVANAEAGMLEDALNYLEESQKIYDKLSSEPGKKAAFTDIEKAMKAIKPYIEGIIHQDTKDFKSSLKKCNDALKLVRDMGERRLEAKILNYIGLVNFELGNFSDAELYYREALIICRKFDYICIEGRLLFNIGTLYSTQNKPSESLEYLNKALKIFEQFKYNKSSMGTTLYEIGHVYFDSIDSINDYSKALDYYKRASAIYQDIGFQKVHIDKMIAVTYERMGCIKQALNTLLEIENNSKDGLIYNKIGEWYSEMGNYKEALNAYNKAMQIYIERNDISHQGKVLYSIGNVYRILGNYLKAIDNLQEALGIFEGTINDDGSKRSTLSALSLVYSVLGDNEKAKEYDLKAKDIAAQAEEISIFEGEARLDKWESLVLLGFDFLKEQKYDKALDVYLKAVEISKKIKNEKYEIDSLTFVGDTYLILAETGHKRKKEFSKALDFYRQALTIAKKKGAKVSMGECYKKIGDVYMEEDEDYWENIVPNRFEFETQKKYERGKEEKYKKAAENYGKALILYKEMGEPEKICDVLWSLGGISNILGQLEKAKNYLSEAIEIVESIREEILVEEYKTSYFGDKLSLYGEIIIVLLKLKADEDAFNYLERTKSRSLLDLLGNRVKLDKGKDKELSIEKMRLLERINKLLEKIRKEQSQPKEKQRAILTKWIEEVEQARKEYTDLLLEIKQKSPELYSLVSINPITIKEVQELMEPDTTLLEYTSIYSTVIIFVINKTEFKVININVKQPTPRFVINTFREKIATLQLDYEKEASELYDLLIRPAKPYIKTTRICIIPHSVLHFLPFQALINTNATKNEAENQNRFLIEEYDIFYAPSASVLKFVLEKRKKVSGKVLAFGNPEFADKDLNLPHAEEEIKRIKESYPDTSIYMNEKATEEKAKSLSGDYDIIHFASHGELNPQSPLFSCIKMAKEKDEDGRLEVHEIFNLDLDNTSLVTLSACETGLGKLTNGDELIGLTRGFIYAGTPSIIASLWMVNDKSTSELMSLFYKNLKTHSKVEALRMAQLEMINGEVGRGIVRGVGGITTSEESEDKPQSSMTVNGSHPYFWAPFILLGDWK